MSMVDVINKHPTLWGIIFSVILGGVGVLLIKSGIDTKKKNALLRDICTERTTGIVTTYEGDFPVYEYEAGGQTYTVKSDRRGMGYKRGQKLSVCYAPDEPEQHYLSGETRAEDKGFWRLAVFGGFLSVFSLGAIIFLIIKGGKQIDRIF